MRLRWWAAGGGLVAAVALAPVAASEAARVLLWGDTHLHTSYSFDAFLNGNQTADPDVAFRYARGEPVIHPYNRVRVQIRTPLDFMVISDHAEFLGGLRDIYYDGVQVEDPGFIESWLYWWSAWRIRKQIDDGDGVSRFIETLPEAADPRQAARSWREMIERNVIPGGATSRLNGWRRITEIADRHNTPGKFTALLGWEWSSTPGGANLHRVVLTDAGGDVARRVVPFGSDNSPFPRDLWDWLAVTADETGAQWLAIPHNPNVSKGMMFAREDLSGLAIDADYAALRMRFERLVEVTQIKGDSETHPLLSPDDRFADFETYTWYLQQGDTPYRAGPGDYVRSGLRTGLALGQGIGVNPFQFGMIGSTDSHTGLSSAEEPNFWGKMGYDSIPENKSGSALRGAVGWAMAAQGLAAVWAGENSREAIVSAMRRRETYATTGTRMRVRLFAGYGLGEDLLTGPEDAIRQVAVPMGGELAAAAVGSAPVLLVEAARDPQSATLDRIQIVKGWVDAGGATHERVYDAAWAGARVADANGKVPLLESTVDLRTGRRDDSSGAAYLRVAWMDPDFDRSVAAFYYARVLEIPTLRHGQMDATALGLGAATMGPPVLQERAYTSPVWYRPVATP